MRILAKCEIRHPILIKVLATDTNVGVSILIHQYHFTWCNIYCLNRQISSTSSTHTEKHLYQIVYGIGKPEMKYEKTESANAIYLTYRLSITVHGICATYNKILSYNNLSYFHIIPHCPLQSPIVRKSNKTTDMCKTQKYSEILELYFICYHPF